MVQLLSPLAARNGLRRGGGAALWKRLTELAGIDLESVVERVLADDTQAAATSAITPVIAEQTAEVKQAIGHAASSAIRDLVMIRMPGTRR